MATAAKELDGLRRQAEAVIQDRVAPALSSAASEAKGRLDQWVSFLPVILDWAEPFLSRARSAAPVYAKAIPSARSLRPARRMEPYYAAALICGSAYVLYRISVRRRSR